jgi:hypothetical protein
MARTAFLALLAWLILPLAGGSGAEVKPRTIIFNGVATEVAANPEASRDLWVSLADLTRATKFELKPEGMCIEKLCFPLPETRKKDFIAQRGSTTWFNLSEFARLLKQPVAHDGRHAIWYFGPRLEEQNGYLKTLLAPDFTLADSNGKNHSLRDFRGKKVLLLTWASW